MDQLWLKFSKGDHITDAELFKLLHATKDALKYLEDRGRYFAMTAGVVRNDYNTLCDFARARNLRWVP